MNERKRFYLAGNQVLDGGQVVGYISDGDSEVGYGLKVWENGQQVRYECDAPEDGCCFVDAVRG